MENNVKYTYSVIVVFLIVFSSCNKNEFEELILSLEKESSTTIIDFKYFFKGRWSKFYPVYSRGELPVFMLSADNNDTYGKSIKNQFIFVDNEDNIISNYKHDENISFLGLNYDGKNKFLSMEKCEFYFFKKTDRQYIFIEKKSFETDSIKYLNIVKKLQ